MLLCGGMITGAALMLLLVTFCRQLRPYCFNIDYVDNEAIHPTTAGPDEVFPTELTTVVNLSETLTTQVPTTPPPPYSAVTAGSTPGATTSLPLVPTPAGPTCSPGCNVDRIRQLCRIAWDNMEDTERLPSRTRRHVDRLCKFNTIL